MKMLMGVLIAGIVGAAQIQDPAKAVTLVKSGDVKWGDHPSIKGAKLAVQNGDPAKGPSVLMMKFPAGMTIPAHWHTSDEVVTIVSGTAVFGSGETVDEVKGTPLGAGSYVVIPGTTPHWAMTKTELIITVTLNKPADFHEVEKK